MIRLCLPTWRAAQIQQTASHLPLTINFLDMGFHNMRQTMDGKTLSTDSKTFNKAITINASTSQVWHTLTTPELMRQWMISDDLEITISTDWRIGSPMVIHGNMNGMNFENNGTVLQFEPEKTLEYSHLSSISRLPDQPESYSTIKFGLQPMKDLTILTLTVSNFPTESIYKHLAFYWNVTLEVLKRRMENKGSPET